MKMFSSLLNLYFKLVCMGRLGMGDLVITLGDCVYHYNKPGSCLKAEGLAVYTCSIQRQNHRGLFAEVTWYFQQWLPCIIWTLIFSQLKYPFARGRLRLHCLHAKQKSKTPVKKTWKKSDDAITDLWSSPNQTEAFSFPTTSGLLYKAWRAWLTVSIDGGLSIIVFYLITAQKGQVSCRKCELVSMRMCWL